MGEVIKHFIITLLLLTLLTFTIEAKDYRKNKKTVLFIKEMVQEHKFKEKYLQTLFKNVTFQKKALGIFNPEHRVKVKIKNLDASRRRWNIYKHGTWTRYATKLIKEEKVQNGIKYMKKYQKSLQKAYKTYGVAPEYITAIIGVESAYGKKLGRYKTFDVLTTLAFEPNRRSTFFKKELKNFLLLARSEKINAKSIKGSYAGAIGLGQFMPSTYAPFMVDFNQDGKRDIFNHHDAIGSIANYFKKNGWKKWEPVAEPLIYSKNIRYTEKATGHQYKYKQSSLKELKVKYGEWAYKGPVRLIKLDRYKYDELWFGAENFYVITRYNHSSYYAMAIHQLAQKIKLGYKKRYKRILR